jgi:hypothetical protein
VTPEIFKALERGRVSISLGKPPHLARLGGLPWGSIVTVRSGSQLMRVISGPVTHQREEWLLSVFWFYYGPDMELSEIEKQAIELRRSWGLDGRKSESDHQPTR